MDVSPKTLREVEFREKMRGYHPEDVDQFLERVAAGIEVLQERLRQALERAQKAEAQASQSGDADDTLRRTLVLAQRTADLAVQEAREQAARILAGAEQQAQAMIADAESEVRRAHERTLVDVQAEITRLEAERQRLQLHVEGLTGWVDEQRPHLTAALRDALTSVESAGLRSSPPASGATSPAATPPAAGAEGRPAGEEAPAEAGAGDGGADGTDRADAVDRVDRGAETGETTATRATGSDVAEAAPRHGGATARAGEGASGRGGDDPASEVDLREGRATAPTTTRTGAASDGPDTMAWQLDPASEEVPVAGLDADPYFARLRQAVNGREPLGPREPDDREVAAIPSATRPSSDAFFDQDLADSRRNGGLFRRRR